jgi:hypothetical protein
MEEKHVGLGVGNDRVPFAWKIADHGVRVDTYWAQVSAVDGPREFGRAETKFYKYEPWSMRNEYQWSTWAGIACGPPSVVPIGMRLMAHAGMNSLGYPGRGELFYPAERWGWRYYNEGVGMNTFSPVIEYENEAEIEAALVSQYGEVILGAPKAKGFNLLVWVAPVVATVAGRVKGGVVPVPPGYYRGRGALGTTVTA